VRDRDAAAWSRCATAAADQAGPIDETDVQATVFIQLGPTGNAPPTLGDDPFTWDGAPWTAGADDPVNGGGGAPCAGDPIMAEVAPGGPARTILVTADAADRETIPPADGATASASAAPGPGREGLQLSALGTAGAFDSQFAGVESTDPAPATDMKLKWTPPAKGDVDVPAAGATVRFVFVLRDLRGGIDWQTRTACLVPPDVTTAAATARAPSSRP